MKEAASSNFEHLNLLVVESLKGVFESLLEDLVYFINKLSMEQNFKQNERVVMEFFIDFTFVHTNLLIPMD